MAVINIEKDMPESCSKCDYKMVCSVFGIGWADANNRYSLGVNSRLDGCPLKSVDGLIKKIQELPKTYPFVNHFDMYVKEDDVIQIIKKYCGGEE